MSCSINAIRGVKCPYCKTEVDVDVDYTTTLDTTFVDCDTNEEHGCGKRFVVEYKATLHAKALKIGGK